MPEFNTGADASLNAAVKSRYEANDDTNAFTDAEQSKLAGIEAAADVTDAGNVGSAIHGASAKTTAADADTLGLIDSAASNVLKKITWANVKATLKTYFDTIYQAAGSYASVNHSHSEADISDLGDYATSTELTTHSSNTSNPHSVTKTQVGLGNVDNTADTAKPISTAQRAGLVGAVEHGATAGTARPTDAVIVIWKGTVEPVNAIDGDIWSNPSA